MISDYYRRGILFVIIFLVLTPVALATSIFALFSIYESQNSVLGEQEVKVDESLGNQNLINSPKNGVAVYASLPSNKPSVGFEANLADARPLIVENYLRQYDSPLISYSDYIVEVADEFGIDFRLITAIAQQESNLCKRIPPGSYNCWGWGIHSRGTLGFQSYEEGIYTVSRGLREEYLDKGYLTIPDIMSKYTPLSKGSWAEGVSSFMQEML